MLAVPDLADLESRWRGLGGGVELLAATPVAERPTLPEEDGATGDVSLTDLLDLALTLRVSGSSKAVMVGLEGLEPPTS